MIAIGYPGDPESLPEDLREKELAPRQRKPIREFRVPRKVRPAGRVRITSEDAWKRRKIGSLEVSLAGLGCNNFGWRIDADGTAAVVNAALEAGINFFDTADVYGAGQSEEYLGRALKGRRDKVLIATKFGMKMGEGKEGAKPAYVRQAVEDSLRRLGTDHIDLYQTPPARPVDAHRGYAGRAG